MPFYDYQCGECNAVTEVKASITQKEQGLAVECRDCQSPNMVQTFRTPAYVSGGESAKAWQPSASAGAACGSHCGCHPH